MSKFLPSVPSFLKRNVAEQAVERIPPTLNRGGRVSHRQRTLSAAKFDRLSADLSTTVVGINRRVLTNQRAIRARSRTLFFENGYYKKFINLLKVNVAGPNGIVYQSQVTNNQGQDQVTNSRIEKYLKNWGKRENCDVAGRLSFASIQQLFIATVAMDGEFLAREIVGTDAGKFGYQLQLLDAEMLDINHNRKLNNGNNIVMGVEFNSVGKRVAYWLLTYSLVKPDYIFEGNRYIRVPADEIIHEFISEAPNQVRGMPWGSAAIRRLHDLAGFDNAALTNARCGAAKMAVWERIPDYEGPVADFGDEDDAEEDYIEDFEPGTTGFAPDGYKANVIDTRFPDTAIGAFDKHLLQGAAVGLFTSYPSLSGNLEGVNFSSIRQGILEDRDYWTLLQNWMSEVFCERVKTKALTYGILTNEINLSFAKFDLLNEGRWQGRRWQWVQPLQDVKAKMMEIEGKIASRSSAIRESGRDPEEVAAEIKTDETLFPQPKPSKELSEEEEKNAE